MFAILSLKTETIWANKKTGMCFIFNSERDAWSFFLQHFSEEEQSHSKIIPVSWVRK